MNQSIIFNDDLSFNKQHNAWVFTGLLSGQKISWFIHSYSLNKLHKIDPCTKYDLEEIVELWLENNEPEEQEVHIHLKN